MSEARTGENWQPCADCPNRSRIVQALAGLAGIPRAEGCSGSVIVSRGKIVTQVRQECEPAPPSNTWNTATSSIFGGERRYSRVDWTEERVCGLEEVKPHEGEVPFDPSGDGAWVRDGQRYVAFIAGDEQSLRDNRAILAVMSALDGDPQ